MTKRRVLVPLDGSEFSRQIVQIVQNFFDPRDVALILLRVAPPPNLPVELPSARDMLVGGYPMAGSYESYQSAMERSFTASERKMETLRTELIDEMRPDLDQLREAGYAVKAEVQFGDPAQRIIQFINDEGIGLVAMATHGRSGLSRVVLGSVAERVLRGAAAPVLLLRPEPAAVTRPASSQLATALGHGSVLSMAVATDGSPFGQRAVGFAGELQRLLGGHLYVLVTTSGREGSAHAQEIMRETVGLVAGVQPKPEIVPLVGFPDEVLLNRLQQHPVNLLVLGAFADRGASGAHTVGPTAHRLVQEAPVSVLLLKGQHHLFRRVLVCAGVEDEGVVALAAEFAQAIGAELQLLHVVPPSAAPYLADTGGKAIDVDAVLAQGTRLATVMRDWEAKLKLHGFARSDMLVQPGSAPEVILKQARDSDYDLLIVGSESSPSHFPGSIANTVVRFADQSVLLVRSKTR